MWVFTRPRSGQEYDLLMSESRGASRFCPIHRFDRLNRISGSSFARCTDGDDEYFFL